MYISIGNKGGIKNEVLIYTKEQKKFPNKQIEDFFKNELKLEKGSNFNIGKLTSYENGKYNYYIIVKLKNSKSLDENVEDIAANIGNSIQSLNKKFFMDLNNLENSKDTKDNLQELLALNLYSFNKYKSQNKNKYELVIKNKNSNSESFKNLVESIGTTRDLVNDPTSNINPENYENFLRDLFKNNKNIKIETIKGKKLNELGLNGIYDVGKGASIDPRLILIKYTPNKSKEFDFGFVGKGVCYDSGGYNIKPTGAMEDMKMDMGGAATVTGAFQYLVNENFDKNIVMGIPLVENLISGDAYKPGDIIKMYNGSTVEIGNTDAEGRLVLADTLTYMEEKFDPKYVFDFATLTGAQLIALGQKITALVGRSHNLNQKIQKISWDIKERTWELPFYEPYFKTYQSSISDMCNISTAGKMGPGTITAGLFLSQFIKNKNWAHFDIAGPAMMGGKDELYGAGATGFGVRILINTVKKLIEK